MKGDSPYLDYIEEAILKAIKQSHKGLKVSKVQLIILNNK